MNIVEGLYNAYQGGSAVVELATRTGIAGFIFDIIDENTIELQAEITDHYLENGTPIQDNIVLKPEKVTLRGYIGEYHRIVNNKKGFLQKTTEKLSLITSYLPVISDFSSKARAMWSNDDKMLSIADIGLEAWDTWQNINIPSDNQSNAFLFFENLWKSRKLVTIQTPYRVYTDMAIESIKVVQSGETIDESSFEVTCKKVRFVLTDYSLGTEKGGRLKGMASKTIDRGTAALKDIKGGWDKFKSWF